MPNVECLVFPHLVSHLEIDPSIPKSKAAIADYGKHVAWLFFCAGLFVDILGVALNPTFTTPHPILYVMRDRYCFKGAKHIVIY